MRSARFFRLVWRIDALLLLAAGIALLVLVVGVASASLVGGHRNSAAPVTVDAAGGTELVFGQVEELEGNSVVLLPLREQYADAKFSSGGGGGHVRNLLAYDTAAGTSRWVFPDNHSIIRHQALSEPGPARARRAARDDAPSPVRWIRYELTPQTTGGRGKPSSIAMSRPDGSALTVVLDGADDILGYGPLRGTRQVVFFRRAAEYLVGEIDYAAPAAIDRKPIGLP